MGPLVHDRSLLVLSKLDYLQDSIFFYEVHSAAVNKLPVDLLNKNNALDLDSERYN